MKKMLSFMLVIVMVLAMTVNVFAVTTIVPNVITPPQGVSSGHTIPAINADYAFTVTTNDTVYRYQLLDEKEAADGKKLYYIFANDLYGTLATLKPTDAAFDPDVETNIAYWLNNDFYNGSATGTNSSRYLDTAIKPYIQNQAHMVEGHAGFGETSPYYWDYTVDLKISLLSLYEYNLYKDKVGYQAYWNGNAVPAGSTTYYTYLRTPYINSSTKALRFMSPGNGNTSFADVVTDGYKYYIRPTFWVSEDYFKNVKLDTFGSEVKKVITASGGTELYDAKELLGISVIEENADNISELPSADWYTGTNATVSDGVIAITEGKWIGRKLPSAVNKGIISVEVDVNYTAENKYLDLCMGFTFASSGGSPSFKYPLYFQVGDSIARYRPNPNSNSSQSYKTFENIYNDLRLDTTKTTAHLKFVVDLDTGYHYAEIDGNYSGIAQGLNYITDNVVNGSDSIDKIVFYNPSNTNNATGYTLDNIKITYDENGSALKSVKALNENTIKVTGNDYASFSNVTASDVGISDCTVASVTPNGNELTVTVNEDLTQDKEYYVIIGDTARNDVSDYTVIGNFVSFIYSAEPFSMNIEITDARFASGETAKAKFTATTGAEENMNLQIIVAAYSGKKLIAVSNPENVSVLTDAVSDIEKEISLPLSDAADLIKAFVWDMNMVPQLKAAAIPDGE